MRDESLFEITSMVNKLLVDELTKLETSKS